MRLFAMSLAVVLFVACAGPNERDPEPTTLQVVRTVLMEDARAGTFSDGKGGVCAEKTPNSCLRVNALWHRVRAGLYHYWEGEEWYKNGSCRGSNPTPMCTRFREVRDRLSNPEELWAEYQQLKPLGERFLRVASTLFGKERLQQFLNQELGRVRPYFAEDYFGTPLDRTDHANLGEAAKVAAGEGLWAGEDSLRPNHKGLDLELHLFAQRRKAQGGVELLRTYVRVIDDALATVAEL